VNFILVRSDKLIAVTLFKKIYTLLYLFFIIIRKDKITYAGFSNREQVVVVHKQWKMIICPYLFNNCVISTTEVMLRYNIFGMIVSETSE
jgi:hypothetical protein